MVLNTNNNRWYYLGYELIFLDLDKHRIITSHHKMVIIPVMMLILLS